MTKSDFYNKILNGLKTSYVEVLDKQISGFKLPIEKGNKISTSNTVEALLIMEEIFGYKFLHKEKLSSFKFDYIKNYLVKQKNTFLDPQNPNRNSIKIIDIAYCGIGLLFFHEIDSANELYDFLEVHKKDNSGKVSWPAYLNDNTSDVLSTYMVIKFYNRLPVNLPEAPFFEDLINNLDDESGIIFNEEEDNKCIEALTIACYVLDTYYKRPIKKDILEKINQFYSNQIKKIYECKHDAFAVHPTISYHIFAFGLAAKLLPNHSDSFIFYFDWEEMNPDFYTKCKKNIPFTLELIKLYNATVCSFDPCSQKSILKINTTIDTINDTINKMNKVKRANITSDNIHEIAITVVAYILLFSIIAIALMFLSRSTLSYFKIPGEHYLAKFETVFVSVGTFIFSSLKFIKKHLKKIVSWISKCLLDKEG